MAIPQVDRAAIERALAEFDTTLRTTSEWAQWESNRAQSWILEHDGLRYPPKKIISMATGLPVGEFSGGPETNDYLANRGFAVSRLRDPSLSETFKLILERYGSARANERFGGNHEIRELFHQARRLLAESEPVTKREHIHVVASYGKGNWATIPWISLLDDRETTTTQNGTYVVYLFREDGAGCYLKLAQGVTKLEKELGARAFDHLAEEATKIRQGCAELSEAGFDLSGKSDLGTSHRLARLYEASTIAAKYYTLAGVPTDEELTADLEAALLAYQRYVDAHGTGTQPEDRRLSPIGTWRKAQDEVNRIREAIAAKGGWASPWSFPIREEAMPRLRAPFYLYAHEGGRRLGARLRVDDVKTSRGQTGIESPWPEITEDRWKGLTRRGERQSDVLKTWFKIGALELLDPPASLDDFELALGLSTPENVLNQNTFGYVIEDNDAVPVVPTATDPSSPGHSAVPPPLPLSWLEARTGLRSDFLQTLVDAVLGESPQVILAGPPGTSKTFLARELALFVTRNRPEQIRLVQFHPSYSYESFMEGLRPVTRGSGVSFELTPGVVLQLVNDMKRLGRIGAEGDEFVVIVDEANRANLPRVLGELMYLFEYREQAVRLQYSSEFTLPPNLRFVATMNTADRSIRSIDIALRRRFDVFEIGPDPDLLARFYAGTSGNDVLDLIEGFVALNAALSTSLDRHHTIGHAFFMRKHMDAGVLTSIWNRRVFPLIEEFFFDQPDRVRIFTVDRFWPSVGNGA